LFLATYCPDSISRGGARVNCPRRFRGLDSAAHSEQPTTMSTARAIPAKKRPSKQNVERREASIDLLLGAARRLFVSQGFRATNLEQISSAAGLTKGAV